MQTVIQFNPAGQGRCLFSEVIDLREVGDLDMTRASTIEWSHRWQHWEVLPQPWDRVTVLYASPSREECIAWEREHFNRELLTA